MALARVISKSFSLICLPIEAGCQLRLQWSLATRTHVIFIWLEFPHSLAAGFQLCIPGNCSRSAMVFLHLLLQVTNCHFNHILFIKEITKFPLDGRASKNVWSCSEITHVFLGFGWIFSINLTSKSLVFSYVMPNLLSNPSNVYFILCFPFLQFPFVFLIFSGMLFIFPNVLFNISMIVI